MNEKDEQLFKAIKKCDLDLVVQLLDEGANPNAKIGDWTLLTHLRFKLPEWRKESTEKYDKGVGIRDALKKKGGKEDK